MEKREKMGDVGKVIAGVVKERMMKNTSETLAAAHGRGELGPRVPHAALSRLAGLSLADEKKETVSRESVESKGTCGLCLLEVMGGERGHNRLRSDEFGGRYFHMECVKKLCFELVGSKPRG